MEVRNWDMARSGAARHVPIPNLLPDSGAFRVGAGGKAARPNPETSTYLRRPSLRTTSL